MPVTNRTPEIVEKRKCHAHSSRTGKPCNNYAMAGCAVCKNHGGNAPQVKKKAKERLMELIDPALAALERNMRASAPPAVQVQAAREVLNRNEGLVDQSEQSKGIVVTFVKP